LDYGFSAKGRPGESRFGTGFEASSTSGFAGVFGYNAREGESAMAAAPQKLIEPNTQNQYDVTAEDLPLSCPMMQMYLWNSHPRVYLPIEPTGWAKCPYCSAEYTLRG
jgi:uncharacterized Zn-finger protein